MCLYPANSLFLDGYLNGKGAERRRTYQMIRDAGFEIVSDHRLDDLANPIMGEDEQPNARSELTVGGSTPIKSMDELRPTLH